MKNILQMTAVELLEVLGAETVSAREVVEATLERIAAHDDDINAFTHVTRERAIREAIAIDQLRSTGCAMPPLAGVPFAVKNLFDLEGVTTVAGSKVLARNPPATRDATLVRRLKKAGAICIGALNMDEFAYGFTTENSHVGPSHNPHDLTRMAGGSSGGSAAAVAAGMLPITLGSDTNGSIRVPSSLCGTFGLKPTFGRLPRTGTFPFVSSLDHLGPFARSVADLALVYDACQGPDDEDHFCAQRPVQGTLGELDKGIDDVRIARLTGYFDEHSTEVALWASRHAASALSVEEECELPNAGVARAAAFAITACEGGALHLPMMGNGYEDYEPLSRDRFVAGSLMPAAWYVKAQKFRQLFQKQVSEIFSQYDVLIAPATPWQAPPIGTEWLEINGKQFPAKASMGMLTQPISFIGLPTVVVPVQIPHGLPIGVQIIAAPWREDLALRVAAYLEKTGVAQSLIKGN